MATNSSSKAPEGFIRLLKNAMDNHPEKLSLNEVARRADLSPAYLSFMLNGKRNAPSNDAIRRLANVLHINGADLNHAAGKPNDAALVFFRKAEAGPLMRSLAKVPTAELPTVRKWIENFVKQKTQRK